MSGTGWMVLNRSQDEVLHRTSSALDAFRMARRAGGRARLERAGPFRVVAIGTSRSLVVVRLATLDADPATGQTSDARERVAIPVGEAPTAETVSLPDGGTFTWVPAGAAWPFPEPIAPAKVAR